MKRRHFITAAAAVAVVAGLPSVPTATVITNTTAAPLPPLRWGWGFWQDGDEMIQGPYATMEEARQAAKYNYTEGESFEVANCDRTKLRHGDYADTVIEWLCEDGRGLGVLLHQTFDGVNEDADWEGEVAKATETVPWHTMALAMIAAVTSLFEREGVFINPGPGVIDYNYSIVDVIDSKPFQDELIAIAAAHIPNEVWASSLLLQPFESVVYQGEEVDLPAPLRMGKAT